MTGVNDQDRDVIAAFRAGQREINGQPLLLLHHVGAKSGAQRLTPLVFWPITNTSVAVLASNYGAARHPAWYHDLLANPTTTAEIGTTTWTVRTRVASDVERCTLVERMSTTNPGVAAAVHRTSRRIPVVILDLAAKTEPESR